MSDKPRKIEEILKEYQSADKASKRDLDSVPETTRAGFGIKIAQAKMRLPALKMEYLTKISSKSLAFLVTGDFDKAQKFAQVAAEVAETFTVDAGYVFDKIADRISPSIGASREFSVTQVSLLDQALKELVEETGYEGRLNGTQIQALRLVRNREGLVSYVKELVAKYNGVTPFVVSVQNALLTQALAAEFTGKRLAAVVLNADESDRKALANVFTRTINVDTSDVTLEQIDEKMVVAVFKGSQGERVDTIAMHPDKPAEVPTV